MCAPTLCVLFGGRLNMRSAQQVAKRQALGDQREVGDSTGTSLNLVMRFFEVPHLQRTSFAFLLEAFPFKSQPNICRWLVFVSVEGVCALLGLCHMGGFPEPRTENGTPKPAAEPRGLFFRCFDRCRGFSSAAEGRRLFSKFLGVLC